MKKKTLALTLAAVLFVLCGCSSGTKSTGTASVTETVPEILNQAEYLLYENIFYNEYGPQYEGKTVEKRGVFARLRDAFNGMERYYVWGYLDATHCCDWQWEIVPENTDSLPPTGSLISVKGTFAADEKALDGYWITGAKITAEKTYTGGTAEIDMNTMSCTLERVQMLNILYMPEPFEGRSFTAYGRIAGVGTLEDPYYDNSWQIPFTSGASQPAIGTLVRLKGQIKAGTLSGCSLSAME